MNNKSQIIWKWAAYGAIFGLVLFAIFSAYELGKNNFYGNSQEPLSYNIDTKNSPLLGNENAKITIVEYSDFQCPFCKQFFDTTFLQIKKDYIDKNKVKFYYKQFPIAELHPTAFDAALASECAGEQGKFWEYHNLLFEKQGEWSDVGKLILKNYTKDLQLNVQQFDKCLDAQKYKDKVNNDLAEGIKLGIDGTPTFFINGVKIIGAQPYSVFKRELDK